MADINELLQSSSELSYEDAVKLAAALEENNKSRAEKAKTDWLSKVKEDMVTHGLTADAVAEYLGANLATRGKNPVFTNLATDKKDLVLYRGGGGSMPQFYIDIKDDAQKKIDNAEKSIPHLKDADKEVNRKWVADQKEALAKKAAKKKKS